MENSSYVLSFEVPGYGTARVLVVGQEDNIVALEMSLPERCHGRIDLYDSEDIPMQPSSSIVYRVLKQAMARAVAGELANRPVKGDLPGSGT